MTGNLILRRDDVLVGRLRVRGGGPDALAARQRVERAAGAALAPPDGLGPSAVLCVRELRVAPAGARPRPSEGVRESLGRLLREAARPALGPVPAAAPAVLFADAAELLACLAGDWCAQTLAGRWWWQALLRRAGGVQAILQAWLGAPEYIPAALGHLTRRGELAPFARALPAAGARLLLQALVRVFALPEIGTSFDAVFEAAEPMAAAHPPRATPPPASRRAGVAAAESAAEVGPPCLDAPTAHAAPEPPWARGVPEAHEAGLTLAARCLVGLGLMLHRAPAEVRARPFSEALRRWAHARAAAPSPAARATAGGPAADSGTPAPNPPGRAGPPAAAGIVPEEAPLTAPATSPSPGAGREAPTLPGPAAPSRAARTTAGGPDADSGTPVPSPPAPAARVVPEEAPLATSATSPLPGAGREAPPAPGPTVPSEAPPSAPAPRRVPTAVPSSDPALLPGEPLETRQGGVFYLINLALFLELYGDFTSPAHDELQLPLWDFLALLGERLAGSALRSDPIWELLARLAGRAPGEPPGRDFAPPAEWRLPAGWLAAFPEPGAWTWSASCDRLRVEHPAGFAVLDVPREPGPAILQVRHELHAHAAGELCEVAPGHEDEECPPLTRWLGWLLPYVRARLCRALALEDADGLAELLLAHRARVVTTATHLDVTLGLAELPLAVRLAGLDRDPGWVPAAGRFVAFHYQ